MSSNSGGVSTLGVVGIVFVILKLVNVIDWSWWWVLAPFWIPAAIIFVAAVTVFLLKR